MIGTRDGGAFEMARITVGELDARGRRRRMDQYDDADQLDAARARFAELQRAGGAAHLENAVSRWLVRFREAGEAHDVERVEALHAPGFELSDRRPLMRLEMTLDEWMRGAHWAFEHSWRTTWETLATRGDRLALVRVHSQVSDDVVGPSEREWLSIGEVNAAGCRSWGALFDPDALDAAFAELDARYFAGEAAAHPRAAATMQAFIAAFASRDWDALGALFAEDVEVRDQRRLGWEPLARPRRLRRNRCARWWSWRPTSRSASTTRASRRGARSGSRAGSARARGARSRHPGSSSPSTTRRAWCSASTSTTSIGSTPRSRASRSSPRRGTAGPAAPAPRECGDAGGASSPPGVASA